MCPRIMEEGTYSSPLPILFSPLPFQTLFWQRFSTCFFFFYRPARPRLFLSFGSPSSQCSSLFLVNLSQDAKLPSVMGFQIFLAITVPPLFFFPFRLFEFSCVPSSPHGIKRNSVGFRRTSFPCHWPLR